MQKVKLKERRNISGVIHEKGTTVEVPKTLAILYFKNGIASEVKEKKGK